MTATELKKAAYLFGALDLLRVTESIKYQVQAGCDVKEALAGLKKQQPALFGPARIEKPKPKTKPKSKSTKLIKKAA